MFLKRIDGPRQVTLPDGTVLSRADLPPPDTSRWVISRKAVVVRAICYGLISQSEAMERYQLSEEEIASWLKKMSEHGEKGLRASMVDKNRQP